MTGYAAPHPQTAALHLNATLKLQAPRALSAPAEGNAPGQRDLAYNIAAGEHFYTLNDNVVVGWRGSTNPPLDNNGLPLVDVTTTPCAVNIKFL